MITELRPLPSEVSQAHQNGEPVTEGVEDAIEDILKRLRILEGAFAQMSVNNANRQVMWNGQVNAPNLNAQQSALQYQAEMQQKMLAQHNASQGIVVGSYAATGSISGAFGLSTGGGGCGGGSSGGTGGARVRSNQNRFMTSTTPWRD